MKRHIYFYRLAFLVGILLLGQASWNHVLCQGFNVRGVVLSQENEQPVIGAAVRVVGSTGGAITDVKGRFTLPGVSRGDTLLISYLGYAPQKVVTSSNKEIQIRLKPNISQLSQLVVVGYGQEKKQDVTGAISSINAEQVANEHPTSVQDILRAGSAGLNVSLPSKAAGGGDLQIRGVNSLSAGTSPLIVVDGVIYKGSLQDINPYDIEKVDILKDASAASVYGSKSASGVIAITTKRGKQGKPLINLNVTTGLATMETNLPVYGPKQFMSWRQDVENSIHRNELTTKPGMFTNPDKLPSGVSLTQWLGYDGSQGDPNTVWLRRLGLQPLEISNYLAGKTTNWYDLAFQNGLRQDYSLSLSGRSDRVSYYWSGEYQDNEGIILGDAYNVIRTRLKLEGKVTDFLTVGMNTQFSIRDQGAVPLNWSALIKKPPYSSAYTDDHSDYRFEPTDNYNAYYNDLGVQKYTDQVDKFYTLNSILYAKITLPFGIKYQANFTPYFSWEHKMTHQSSAWPSFADQGGAATRESELIYQWQLDNILSWSKTFHHHHLDVTLLQNSEKYNQWEEDMSNNHFDPNDNLGYHMIGAGLNPVVNSTDEYSTGSALMARVFYSFQERYLVTLSFRRDGNSAFGRQYPWANFPSASLGWIFTQEPFFKADWLDFGKLRLSYGVNGNSDIGRYIALSQLGGGKVINIDGQSGDVIQASELFISRMPNEDLQWERTASFNMGLDFSLFHDRLSGSIDAYKSKTTNLLMLRMLPDILGFDNVWSNLGEVDNHGLEVSLSSRNLERKNLRWSTSVNFSLNRNEIRHLYGNTVEVTDANGKVIGHKEADDLTNGWFIGHAVDAVWDYKVQGVYQTNEAEEAAKYNKEPGDFKLQDVNGDGKYTNADKQFLGYTTPRFRWSMRNEFTFHEHFSFSFMLYSNWGQLNMFNDAKHASDVLDRFNDYTIPYWTEENPTNEYSRLKSNDAGTTFNIYRRSSFIRLENVSIAYHFPASLVQRAKIQDLRVYFTTRNVGFYAPDWEEWDPETLAPTPRVFTFGLNLTL